MFLWSFFRLVLSLFLSLFFSLTFFLGQNKNNTFRSRGIDGITARRVLVQSFGAEVTAALPGKDLRKRVDAAAGVALSKVSLESAPEG